MRRVRLRDIAEVLNVSESTVSRALNNRPGVNNEMRERIFRVAQELNYPFHRVNPGAGPRRRIGLVFPDISNTYFATVSYGIASVLGPDGALSFVVGTDEDAESEAQYVRALIEQGVDGMIAAPAAGSGQVYQEALAAGVPLVFVDRRHRHLPVPSVTLDNRDAIFQAVRRLHELGHRRVALIAGDPEIYTGYEREQGFREAIDLLGLRPEDCPIAYGQFRVPTAYQAARDTILSRRVTAIIATSNKTTVGVLKAIKELGLRTPDDVSVIGFDDQEWTAVFEPPLSVVSQPAFTMGVLAANLLLQRIQGSPRQESVVLKAEILWRESVAEVSTRGAEG